MLHPAGFQRGEKRIETGLLLGLALAVSGCMSFGTKVSQSDLVRFQKGVSTVSEAIGVLGSPNRETDWADGTRELYYIYSDGGPVAAQYLPVAGAFIGKTTPRSSTTRLTFSPDGKLREAISYPGELSRSQSSSYPSLK